MTTELTPEEQRALETALEDATHRTVDNDEVQPETIETLFEKLLR